MSSLDYENKTNLATIIVKPLYFGLVSNIVIPMALLLVCYYINNNYPVENKIGDAANIVFYLFAFLALVEAGFALWWRNLIYHKPMIRRAETFEADFVEALLARSKPVFLVIASISVYGYLYFFLTGRFPEAVLFVVFSFLVFQVVRPRYGMVKKLLIHQQSLVDNGMFLK
ncbi:MAG: hypothetical protein ACOYVF_04890 [Candidatus Zixiibacteriota bacterium]